MLLVWSAIIGFLAWGDVPGAGLIVGSFVIVASGVLLIYRENAQRRAQATLRPAVESTVSVLRICEIGSALLM